MPLLDQKYLRAFTRVANSQRLASDRKSKLIQKIVLAYLRLRKIEVEYSYEKV